MAPLCPDPRPPYSAFCHVHRLLVWSPGSWTGPPVQGPSALSKKFCVILEHSRLEGARRSPNPRPEQVSGSQSPALCPPPPSSSPGLALALGLGLGWSQPASTEGGGAGPPPQLSSEPSLHPWMGLSAPCGLHPTLGIAGCPLPRRVPCESPSPMNICFAVALGPPIRDARLCPQATPQALSNPGFGHVRSRHTTLWGLLCWVF